MAASRPNLWRAALLLGWVLAGGARRAGVQQPQQLPISLDATSSEVDYKTNTVVFTDVVIAQGNIRVQGEHAHATGLNFENSRWTFDGKVRISAEQRGTLRSDQAIVEFRDNRIAKATITGSPAEFEQQRADSVQVARGHADEIVYDVGQGTVRLANQAWLSDGHNEISGPLLVYNIREERGQAATSPRTDERVHITIAPRDDSTPGKPQSDRPEPNRPKSDPQP